MNDDKSRSEGMVIEGGFGIISAPTGPSENATGLVFVFCFVAALLFAGFKCVAGARGEDWGAWSYVLAAVLILLGVLFGVIWVAMLRSHMKSTGMMKSFTEGGIWVTGDHLYAGKFKLEFRDEIPFSSIDSIVPIPLLRVTWLQDPNSLTLDARMASPALQLVNSKYDAKDFRIARLHIMVGDESKFIHNMMLCRKIMIGDSESVASVTQQPLVRQLQKVLDGIKQYRGKPDPCTLLITPRGGQGSLVLFGAIGGIIKSISDRSAVSQIRKDFETGQFVDKVTGKMVLKLIEEEGWAIHIRPLGTNELGLAGGEW